MPVPDQATVGELREQVALTTAKIPTGWFDSNMVLGVAWGTAHSAIAQHPGRKPTGGLNSSAEWRGQ